MKITSKRIFLQSSSSGISGFSCTLSCRFGLIGSNVRGEVYN